MPSEVIIKYYAELCENCGKAVAVWCQQCGNHYCFHCSEERHQHPSRKSHVLTKDTNPQTCPTNESMLIFAYTYINLVLQTTFSKKPVTYCKHAF